MSETKISDDEISVTIGGHLIASFSDCGNGMDGSISEGDETRLGVDELLSLSMWLVGKAQERARQDLP